MLLVTTHRSFIRLILLSLSLFASAANASDKQRSDNWLSVVLENDFIADDDAGYTHGMGAAWGRLSTQNFDQLALPDWAISTARNLPGVAEGKHFSFSQAVSQSMFTPEDIDTEELIENDRPYAGILLWHGRLNSFSAHRATRYQLQLGVLGPLSGAEQVQTSIHKLRGVGVPKGWKHQLQNEPLVALSIESLHRLALSEGPLEVDAVGVVKAQAGNLKSEVGLGLSLRLGKQLQRSFATANSLPGRNERLFKPGSVCWHLFVSAYAVHVFNDITLDGNTFRDSHSVSLIHNQALVSAGLSIEGGRWGAQLAIQDGSQNFQQREENRMLLHLAITHFW